MPEYQDIFPNELQAWRDRSASIIDVREPWEYQRGHVPGAENVPLGELADRANEIADPVVLVCASGNRSASAAEYLASLGRTEVANLLGGTAGWTGEGRPTE